MLGHLAGKFLPNFPSRGLVNVPCWAIYTPYNLHTCSARMSFQSCQRSVRPSVKWIQCLEPLTSGLASHSKWQMPQRMLCRRSATLTPYFPACDILHPTLRTATSSTCADCMNKSCDTRSSNRLQSELQKLITICVKRAPVPDEIIYGWLFFIYF